MEELEGSPNLLTSAGFNVCNAKLQATDLTTIRKAISSSLPSNVAFQRSMDHLDHSFAQDLDTFSERVLLVTNKLFFFEFGCDGGSITRYARKRERISWQVRTMRSIY